VVGTVATAMLTVPPGELWLLNRINITRVAVGAGEFVSINFRISAWPYPDVRGGATVNPAGRAYLADDLTATGSSDVNEDIDFPAQGELGTELRLKGGDTITLVAVLTGAVAAAARDVTLTPYGRKVRKLVS